MRKLDLITGKVRRSIAFEKSRITVRCNTAEATHFHKEVRGFIRPRLSLTYVIRIVVTGERKKTTKSPASPDVPSVITRTSLLGSPTLASVLLAVITLVIFLPVARNDFVNYDDTEYVSANPHVQGLRWSNVVWAFTTGHSSNWHPLTWLSHMVDWQLFGSRPAAHHLVNVGFHIANTILLFLFLRRITDAHWRSAFVAALFAWHPLHVESVAWASERKDVLSALFFLLTLMAYRCFSHDSGSREPAPSPVGATAANDQSLLTTCYVASGSAPARRCYGVALVCFALGLMSKPMLVTVPFVLLLLDFWPLRRLSLPIAPVRLGGLLLEKAPFFALSLASCIVTFLVQRKGGAVSTSISLGARLANAVVAYVRYLGDCFWPRRLSVLYPHPGHWPAWEVAAAATVLLTISVLVVVSWRKRPYLVVGWCWFLGMLVPTIGLIQVGVQSMADRYMYLPSIGVFLMVAWGIRELLRQRESLGETGAAEATGPLAAGAGVVLFACAILSMKQIGYWKDSETLFRHAVEVTRSNYLAYNNLGFYLSGKGQTAAAMENYVKALEINPAYEDAHNNIGFALAGRKQYAEAIAHYQAALRIKPNHVEVHNNLGNALADTGQIDQAIEHYRIVLKQNPDHADAHNNLGIALSMKGQFDEAMEHFHAALRLKPDYASAHSNLGNAYAVQHKLDDAIREYQESLRLNPKDHQAHNNLANALSEQGRLDEAITHYTEALRLNVENPEANYNLGLALVRKGKQSEALAHFQEALRLKPDYAEARQQLLQAQGK